MEHFFPSGLSWVRAKGSGNLSEESKSKREQEVVSYWGSDVPFSGAVPPFAFSIISLYWRLKKPTYKGGRRGKSWSSVEKKEKSWWGRRGITISETLTMFTHCCRNFIHIVTFRLYHNSMSCEKLPSEWETKAQHKLVTCLQSQKNPWWCQHQIQCAFILEFTVNGNT